MMLLVRKYPATDTYAHTQQVADDFPPLAVPAGWELMATDDYAAWLAEQPPLTPSAQSPVPDSVSPWQIRRALNAAGLRATVEAAIAAADQDTRDAWEYATEIRRDHPLVLGLAAAIHLSEPELDDLFRAAAAV